MEKIELTRKNVLRFLQPSKDNIYDMYTTEEVLEMQNVSEEEKDEILSINILKPVVGWVENKHSTQDNKIFVQIYPEDLEKH